MLRLDACADYPADREAPVAAFLYPWDLEQKRPCYHIPWKAQDPGLMRPSVTGLGLMVSDPDLMVACLDLLLLLRGELTDCLWLLSGDLTLPL